MSKDVKSPPKTEKQRQADWHKEQARKKTPAYKEAQKKKLKEAMEQIDSEVKKSEDKSKTKKLYHLTDNPNFKLDDNFAPEDNAVAIHDRSGRKGIYLTPNVENWVNGQGYHRPFVAEFEVPEDVSSHPEHQGRWGGEKFIPNHHYDKMKLNRVIPIDAHCREKYQSGHGWFEREAQTEFDTGKPISNKAADYDHYRFKGYKYSGKDVRDMSTDEVNKLKHHFERGRKAMTGETDEDIKKSEWTNEPMTLSKAVYGSSKPKIHGWISPKGEYHEMPPKMEHDHFISKQYPDSEDSYKKAHSDGWVSVGLAGSNSHSGPALKKPTHPATVKLRQLIDQHDMRDKLVISHGTYEKPSDVDADHFIKHGTIKNPIYKSEPLDKIATAGHVLNTANQVGGAATEGLVHKPMATGPNANKLKAKYAKIQAKKQLEEKNPDENWDKHLALKSEGNNMKFEDLKKMAEELQKRSKNVRRELARINAGKKGDEKAIAREEKYAKDKAGISEVKQSPNIGELASKYYNKPAKDATKEEKKVARKEANDSVTNMDKKKAGWKRNKNGKYIHKPVIGAKKDGTSALTHIGTPKSIRHETAHVIRADDSIVDLDHKMQAGFGKIKSKGAASAKAAEEAAISAGGSQKDIAAAKKKGDKVSNPHAHQGEYETNGIENAIARRTGSLPPRNTVGRDSEAKKKYGNQSSKNEKDPLQVGMGGALKDKPIHKLVPKHTSMESSVVRRDRQAKEKAAAKKKGKEYVKPSKQKPEMVHIASLSDNVRPHIKTKVEQKLDTGEIKHNPKNGGKPEIAQNIDAKINGRAAGRRDIKDDVKPKQSEKLAASEAGKDVKSLLKSLISKITNKE